MNLLAFYLPLGPNLGRHDLMPLQLKSIAESQIIEEMPGERKRSLNFLQADLTIYDERIALPGGYRF